MATTILTEEERKMLHVLAIRLQGRVCQIAEIVRETGGNLYSSAEYNNSQEIRTAVDRIMKCAENRYAHKVSADGTGVRYGVNDN